MSHKVHDSEETIRKAVGGTLLACDGAELATGIWESSVHLGADGFVYHIVTTQSRGGPQRSIEGKRAVGEYLRWVDGLFRPGELPSGPNGVHYRAARKLRELI